jgi:hypothetical protein
MKRGAVVFLLLLIAALIFSARIDAFGISTPYIKDDTLLVNPGKTYDYSITLQNNGDQGYYVDIAYSSTEDVASLDNTEQYVLAGTYNTTIHFKLSIPETAQIGKTYALEYSAKPRIEENGTVSMGVEIKRGITILVTDGTTNAANTVISTEETAAPINDIKKGINIEIIKKYALLIIILIILIFIIKMLWHLSKRMSSKIGKTRQTKYTISEAISLEEVKKLLQNIDDEAFEVSEIKNLFKDKLSELTTNDISHRMQDMSRKEIIRAIDKIKR